MPIIAFGLNHHSAGVELREQIAVPEAEIPALLRTAQTELADISELVVLSTCNRTEVYAVLTDDDPDEQAHIPLLSWLAQRQGVAMERLEPNAFCHFDDDAVQHICRVACGLDSQVLGEPQILGQLKAGLEMARQVGTIGPQLDAVARHSLGVAKQVRTDTDLGRNPISVAFAAVSLAERIFADLSQTQALLLGAGDTIELVARHLRERGVNRIVIANRTLANAEQLAQALGGEAALLSDAPMHLPHSDIVIGSTGSPLPVLGKGAVEAALRQRKRRPIFMVDIAVPRDIEPQVAELNDVYLYTVDDLTEIIQENLRSRREAALQAEGIIEAGMGRFQRDRRIRGRQQSVRALREHAETIRDQEVGRAVKALTRGAAPEAVIEQLAASLTNKLLHRPTVALREAGANDRQDVIDLLSELYDLDEPR